MERNKMMIRKLQELSATGAIENEWEEPSQAFWLTDPDKGRTLRTSVHVTSKNEQWEAVDNEPTPAWITKA